MASLPPLQQRYDSPCQDVLIVYGFPPQLKEMYITNTMPEPIPNHQKAQATTYQNVMTIAANSGFSDIPCLS